MEVIDWLLESGQLSSVVAQAKDIDERLVNIRSFFVIGWGLTRQQVQHSLIPVGSPLSHHIYGVLFSDAVRWWAAAHRSRQDENKYLRDAMYKGDFAALKNHFYHGFRNNQLAHFPGGIKNNDHPLLTPAPYGFFLSQKELDDFRALLAYSIKLTFLGAEKVDEFMDQLTQTIETSFMSEEQKTAVTKALQRMLDDWDKEMLSVPTRNHLPGESPE